MKKRIPFSFLGLGILGLSMAIGCGSLASSAKSAAENSSSDPRVKAEVKRILDETKNPKKPEIVDSRVVGKLNAPITIVEYSDYNCTHCAHAHETVQKVKAKYGDKVRFVFKNFPVLDPGTGTSKLAAEYVEALGLQGADKSYAFHSALFEKQSEFGSGKETFLKETLKTIAKQTGGNADKATKDLKSAAVKKIIDADTKEAGKFGFLGTPAFLINGATLPGNYPAEVFYQVIDTLLAGKS